VKRTFALLKVAFAMAILYLFSMAKGAFNKNKVFFTNLSLYGRIILKQILQEKDGGYGRDFFNKYTDQ